MANAQPSSESSGNASVSGAWKGTESIKWPGLELASRDHHAVTGDLADAVFKAFQLMLK
jgi:hypothetical protein